MEKAEASPCGHYLAAEVGQLAGVSGKCVGQWARRNYIGSSWSNTPPLVYAYQDVAEAMVVHELEVRGVLPAVIGSAVEQLRERFGMQWPLQHSELFVPERHPRAKGKGRTVALSTDDGIWDLSHNHLVLRVSDLVSIAKDLARGGWAARDLPNLRYIEVNPNRLSGRPTIKGRRIAAQFVATTARTQDGSRVLRREYDLTPSQVDDAVRWWGKVQVYEVHDAAA